MRNIIKEQCRQLQKESTNTQHTLDCVETDPCNKCEGISVIFACGVELIFETNENILQRTVDIQITHQLHQNLYHPM